MLQNQHVLVLGAGRSGLGAAKLLSDHRAVITILDSNRDLDQAKVLAHFTKEEQQKIRIAVGDLTEELLNWAELAILSPGIPIDHDWVLTCGKAGIPVWGEIELAYRVGKGDILAITGTNGKTTTTTLLGEIMKHAGRETFVVGNIGTAFTEVADQTHDDSVVVAEISSFQLESAPTFHPVVSSILNITPDHLNRHYTMENYAAVKERIAANQTGSEACVLNYEDEMLRAFGEETSARVLYFSSEHILEEGIWLEDGQITYHIDGRRGQICHVDDLQLLGVHNYENVMAACAMALAYGVDPASVAESVEAFEGVAHRIEFVCEREGVAYYNDSKGTNPDASIRAIKAMKRPTLLIGGGYDKGSDYKPWIKAFDGKVKEFVLIGATREAIRDDALACGFDADKIVLLDTFEEAVDRCMKDARPGDAVLLSPACASWGMFKDYEQRGDVFKELVRGSRVSE